jgi:hypothetical protein
VQDLLLVERSLDLIDDLVDLHHLLLELDDHVEHLCVELLLIVRIIHFHLESWWEVLLFMLVLSKALGYYLVLFSDLLLELLLVLVFHLGWEQV